MDPSRQQFKSEADRLYAEAMGPAAFDRQSKLGKRACTCDSGASEMKPWAHKPGCRLKDKR